jgi:hypothetical protein
VPAIKWPVLDKTILNNGVSSERMTDQMSSAALQPAMPSIGRLYARKDIPSLQGSHFFSPPSNHRSGDCTAKFPVEATSGQEDKAWSGVELPFMLWPTKDDRSAHISLRDESVRGTGRTSNTKKNILPSRARMDQFSSGPSIERHLTHPMQLPGMASLETQAEKKGVNYSLAMSTPKRQSTLTTFLQNLKTFEVPQMGIYSDQRHLSDNEKPDGDGHMTPTHSETSILTPLYKDSILRSETVTDSHPDPSQPELETSEYRDSALRTETMIDSCPNLPQFDSETSESEDDVVGSNR